MKKLVLVLVGILFATQSLLAATEKVGNYTWTYRINGDSAEIYKGSSSAAISPRPTGVVVIPSTLGGKPVESVGAGAFYGCGGLISVTIPDGVKSIGDQAFFTCTGLSSVSIPDSVTSIGQLAFGSCSGLTNVVIGCGVTSIGYRAFDNCSSMISYMVANENLSYKATTAGLLLTKDGSTLIVGVNGAVVIPEGVQRINDWAFFGLTNLTSITLPASVTSIDDINFNECDRLTSFVVADENPTYKSIGGLLLSKDGYTVIRGVNGDVTIPNSVTNIQAGAFFMCRGLTRVTIPAGVTSIGIAAFSVYSDKLMAYDVSDDNPSYKSESGLLLTKDGKTLVSAPSSMTNLVIPNSVTSIGDAAFRGCCGLVNASIPNNVTNIGEWAFYACENLTRVTIPNSVTRIRERAFGECGLTSVIIPNSVTSIEERAFHECINLTTVTIPDSVTSIGAYAFNYCYSLESVTIGNGVTDIGNSAFYLSMALTNVIFKGNAPRVGSSAFYNAGRFGSGCTAYVKRDSTGWDVSIPGKWQGMNVKYLTSEIEIAAANAAGSGTVELDGEVPAADVASGVTVVVKGENLDAVALAAVITPLPHEAGQDESLFKVAASTAPDGSVLLSVVLDEEAVDPDETAGEIVSAANAAAFGAAADGESVSVDLPSAKSGLYYGIAAASDLSQLEAVAANVPLERAGANGATISVAKPAGGTAFFKVIVSDRMR